VSKTDTGGAAFPRPVGNYPHYGCTYSDAQSGMTLRDYFAGQALAGVWAGRESDLVKISAPTTTDVAVACYAIADAMIKARSGHGRPSGEA
jgi:hypothetical protein